MCHLKGAFVKILVVSDDDGDIYYLKLVPHYLHVKILGFFYFYNI